VNVRLRSRW